MFRLISDRTIEENILKKAQQKRLLGNIAIEGGNFTAAYFKQDSVKELFNMNPDDQDKEEFNNRLASSDKKTEEVATVPAMKAVQYEQVTLSIVFSAVSRNLLGIPICLI